MKILIGYDGSECADAALGLLNRSGLPAVAGVRVLSVAEVWLPPPDPDDHKATLSEDDSDGPIHDPRYAKARRAVQEAQDLATVAASRVTAFFPDWKVSASSSYGSPPWEIIFAADKWRPDLILVGSQGHSALGRFVLGSVSQVVLTEAQCSVRVARGRVAEPDSPIRIVVGLDGSADSYAAAREVANRPWPAKTEVKLVVVDDPIRASFVVDDFRSNVGQHEDHAWAETILRDHAALFRERPGIEVTTDLIEGSPKNELVKVSEEWGADCIFVGSSGTSNRASRFVLGSVSAAVSARAHCSVEVVRKK